MDKATKRRQAVAFNGNHFSCKAQLLGWRHTVESRRRLPALNCGPANIQLTLSTVCRCPMKWIHIHYDEWAVNYVHRPEVSIQQWLHLPRGHRQKSWIDPNSSSITVNGRETSMQSRSMQPALPSPPASVLCSGYHARISQCSPNWAAFYPEVAFFCFRTVPSSLIRRST